MPPSLGHRGDLSRSISTNSLAWCDLVLDDPTLVAEALEMSAAAIRLLPEHPAVRGTRAFALILGGRPGEGIDLGLAAYARDWRFPQADRWIARARRADPACPLLVRAGAELDARRSGRDGAVAESG